MKDILLKVLTIGQGSSSSHQAFRHETDAEGGPQSSRSFPVYSDGHQLMDRDAWNILPVVPLSNIQVDTNIGSLPWHLQHRLGLTQVEKGRNRVVGIWIPFQLPPSC